MVVAIDAQTARFLTSPVMIILGTADAALKPAIGRGLGCRLTESGGIEVVFSRWQWPRTAADITATGRVAITWARPSDYVSYQLKGPAEVRPCDEDDIVLAERYRIGITDALTALGVSDEQVAHWICPQDLMVTRMAIAEAYVQTPGERAGVRL